LYSSEPVWTHVDPRIDDIIDSVVPILSQLVIGQHPVWNVDPSARGRCASVVPIDDEEIV
jgi:hypothetical protein